MTKVAIRNTPEKTCAGGGAAEGTSRAPFLVLGLGNELLKDDAVGIRVAEKLQGNVPDGVEVRCTPLFGLSLLDDLIGREKVLLIDSYLPEDLLASEICEIDLDSLGNSRAPCPHCVGLAEIREIMRSLDLGFPREVRVLAIPVTDPLTFSADMSPEVRDRADYAAEHARRVIREWLITA
ncbi:MAG: hydrogenase maturation protease [Deltaproteobacteria bacterium]